MEACVLTVFIATNRTMQLQLKLQLVLGTAQPQLVFVVVDYFVVVIDIVIVVIVVVNVVVVNVVVCSKILCLKKSFVHKSMFCNVKPGMNSK